MFLSYENACLSSFAILKSEFSCCNKKSPFVRRLCLIGEYPGFFIELGNGSVTNREYAKKQEDYVGMRLFAPISTH
ncbi:hypothetical protein LguiA_003904 [Lonicera macranthoides]